MDHLVVSSFYKYVDLANPETFQNEHLNFCNSLGVKGKVLVSKEGINGVVSGTKEQIEQYEKRLLCHKDFLNMSFKRNIISEHPFKKTIVRLRNEIVTSRFDVDATNVGNYLTPLELKKMYDHNADFVIIDARNEYESRIGKFKNAITSNIDSFRDFPKIIPQLEKFKDKKLVLYCTGGVRCEKASALLIKNGFKDVNQVKDGILNFVEQYPDTYFYGRCFVFDNRLSVNTGKNTKDISICERCHKPCGDYINCLNTKCDQMFICCSDCVIEYNHTCSKTCRGIVNSHTRLI